MVHLPLIFPQCEDLMVTQHVLPSGVEFRGGLRAEGLP